MFVRLNFFIAVVLFSTLFTSSAIAQEVSQSVDITIQSNPIEPKPEQTVSLEAISYSVDLNQASITWTYGGKVIASGIGKTAVAVIAPKSGSVASVTVTVSTQGIDPVSATITLRPGSIDLLWEGADGTVPPFYKGRVLPAPGGVFRVVAVPAAGAPRQSNFQWVRNDSAVASASGAGKSEILLQNTAFERQEKIQVAAMGGVFQGNASTIINPQSPSIVAYQKRNGFINYAEGSTSSLSSQGQGMTAVFEPFFFSLPRKSFQDIAFTIKDGAQTIYGEDAPNEINFSRPENNAVGAITVEIMGREYSLQNMKKNFSILFE